MFLPCTRHLLHVPESNMHSQQLLAGIRSSVMIFSCLYLFASAQAPADSKLPQISSTPFNMSYLSNATSPNAVRDMVVFPKNPQRVTQVNQSIFETITTSIVRLIPSSNRPEFSGVLFWVFEADDNEIQELRNKLGDDVS